MKPEELQKAFEQAKREAAFARYRPLGHPDTLCPDGELWRAMGWPEWTNKPWQLDFHNMSVWAKERAIIAGTGNGKSYPTAWETACHLLGDYPDWYEGHRFEKPVRWWVAAIDADQQREGIQSILLGPDLDKNLGTGFLPRSRIVGRVRIKQAGISEIADRVVVRHASGGFSNCTFKTYAQGWRSFQAAKPDGVTMDEEPDERDNKQRGVFEECQSRIFRSGGVLLAALTPLLGETALTRHFMYPKHPAVGMVSATWNDAPHLDPEERARMEKTYPDYVQQTRIYGLPMMGEGRVFTTDEAELSIAPFEIPRHFARIAGIDFGIHVKHPTAGAWLAWDRHNDIVYLYGTYRKVGEVAVVHAEAFKRRGKWIPISWPHDGHIRDKGFGCETKDHYRNHGLNMLSMSARYDKDRGGKQDPWPIIQEMNERMATGRFKVFNTCGEFFEEFRSYHSQDGKLVAHRDDVMKAVMYAMMMLRYAYTEPSSHAHEPSYGSTMRVNV